MQTKIFLADDRDAIDIMVERHRRQNMEDSDDEEAFDEFDPPKPVKKFVDWSSFNWAIGLVILANAVIIGLQTDANAAGVATPPFYDIIDFVCNGIFLAELICRFYFAGIIGYFRRPGKEFSSFLDVFVVGTSIIDIFILAPLGNSTSARLVSMVRFARLLRLIRLLRLLKIFKELWLVASGLIQSLKTLFWIFLLIFVFCYVCAIFTTVWIGHDYVRYDPYFITSGGWDHKQFFGTMVRSTLTLFQIMTIDHWSDAIVRHVLRVQPSFLIFFLFFLLVTMFGILNIIVGVVCDSSLQTAIADKKQERKIIEKDRQRVFQQLRDIFEEADADGSGTLTLQEVVEATLKPEIYSKLKLIGFPVDNPSEVFELLDFDETGELAIEEFITGCNRMRGQAKSKDLLVAQVEMDRMRKHYDEFEEQLGIFQDKIKRLTESATALTFHGEHVFLDTWQYRARHPDFKKASVPRVTAEELASSPWEVPRQPGDNYTEGQIVPIPPKSQVATALETMRETPAMALDLQSPAGSKKMPQPPALPPTPLRRTDSMMSIQNHMIEDPRMMNVGALALLTPPHVLAAPKR